jgi:ribonuclease HI
VSKKEVEMTEVSIDASVSREGSGTGLAVMNRKTKKFIIVCLPLLLDSTQAEQQAFHLAALWNKGVDKLTIYTDSASVQCAYTRLRMGIKTKVPNAIILSGKLLSPSVRAVKIGRDDNTKADFLARYSREHQFTGGGVLIGDRPPFTLDLKPMTWQQAYHSH